MSRQLTFLFCHRKPDRSFFWKGRQFPVCARCTGIYTGYLAMPVFMFGFFSLNLWWTLAMILPTVTDGWTQAFLNRESNNGLRFGTGLLAGVGLMSLAALIGQVVSGFLKQLFF